MSKPSSEDLTSDGNFRQVAARSGIHPNFLLRRVKNRLAQHRLTERLLVLAPSGPFHSY